MEKRVEAVLPYVTNAQIGDATDEEVFKLPWECGTLTSAS